MHYLKHAVLIPDSLKKNKIHNRIHDHSIGNLKLYMLIKHRKSGNRSSLVQWVHYVWSKLLKIYTPKHRRLMDFKIFQWYTNDDIHGLH